MGNTALYEPYGGPKLCGGYHPDYCFEWHSPQGPIYGLLCTGCREIIMIGGGTEVYCDLSSIPAANGARAPGLQAEELQKLLDELK